MKTMFIAFAAIIVIAVGADYALKELPFSTADTATRPSVRLGNY
ncbi:MAG: hypothetical protein WCD16_02155 [Paracoccaceae bacterium]